MSKALCLFLLVVAASLTKVSSLSNEEKKTIRSVFAPFVAECSAEQGVSEEDLMAAKKAQSLDSIKSCFIACIMKKFGIMTKTGYYNPENGLGKLRAIVSSDEDFTKFEQVGRKCITVNIMPVTDFKSGCDRAKLALACIMQNQETLPG